MRRIASLFATLFVTATAASALAIPQAPHDAAAGIGCADCHAPYGALNDPAASTGAADATSTAATLVDLTKAWTAGQWVGGVVTFTSGANNNKFRVITASTATSVSWSGDLPAAPAAGDTYKIGKTTESDIETRCKSCHNPTGQASAMAGVGQHQTDKGPVGCGKCHDPHNTVDNTGVGNGLVRKVLSFDGETPVLYPSGGSNPYISSNLATPGLCQACHTKTRFFKADGTGDDTHNAATDCMSCHNHEDGFGTSLVEPGAHVDPTGLAFTYASATGGSCSRCHTASGAKTWQQAFVANGQTAIPANSPAGAMGPLTCDTCHNTNAEALTKIPFQSAAVVVTAPDPATALCGQCHQGRNSTPAVNNSLGVNFNGTATGGTTTTMDSTTSNFNKNLVGAVIQFTNGKLYGQVRNITAYTATQVTFSPALASAPLVTTTFRIAGNGATNNDLDTVVSTGFANVHYFAAAGTLFGGNFPALGGKGTQVGYEYAQIGAETSFRKYATQNFHVKSKDGCVDCHDPHEFGVRIDTCGSCHTNEIGAPVATVEELADSRIFGWEEADFDGDGTEEGLKAEIDGMAATLYAAIQAYATPVSGQAICYHSGANPYWFKDTNANGVCDGTYEPTTHTATGELLNNSYNGKWTPRLMKAAYNYQVYVKDPGAWAHNPMYIIELLFDSISDLNVKLTALGTPVIFTGTRTRFGHFDQDSDVFRHWDYDATNTVPAACAQCHAGAEGLSNYLANPGTNTLTATPVYGMQCLTCHPALPNGDPDFSQGRDIATVRFPPTPPAGVTPTVLSMQNTADNLCATCHSARESKGTIDLAIGVLTDASWTLSFKNSHYLGSAAVLAGGDAHVGYEYPAKTYATAWMHDESPASCQVCHDPANTKHTFEVAKNTAYCASCHGTTDYATFKGGARTAVDYDGDAAVENLPDEMAGMLARLNTAIQDYCAANAHTCTYSSAYPYWAVTGATTKMNPRVLKAAYNYNFLVKAEGAWAHNFSYSAQLVYDSIEDLGGSLAGLVRP